MALALERESVIKAQQRCEIRTDSSPNGDSVALIFGDGDAAVSANSGAIAVAAICHGANKRISGYNAFGGSENGIELLFEETEEETIDTTFGELQTGDEILIDNQRCMLCRSSVMHTTSVTVMTGPRKGWTLEKIPAVNQKVKKIVRRALPEEGEPKASNRDRVTGTLGEAIADVLANHIAYDDPI